MSRRALAPRTIEAANAMLGSSRMPLVDVPIRPLAIHTAMPKSGSERESATHFVQNQGSSTGRFAPSEPPSVKSSPAVATAFEVSATTINASLALDKSMHATAQVCACARMRKRAEYLVFRDHARMRDDSRIVFGNDQH